MVGKEKNLIKMVNKSEYVFRGGYSLASLYYELKQIILKTNAKANAKD